MPERAPLTLIDGRKLTVYLLLKAGKPLIFARWPDGDRARREYAMNHFDADEAIPTPWHGAPRDIGCRNMMVFEAEIEASYDRATEEIFACGCKWDLTDEGPLNPKATNGARRPPIGVILDQTKLDAFRKIVSDTTELDRINALRKQTGMPPLSELP